MQLQYAYARIQKARFLHVSNHKVDFPKVDLRLQNNQVQHLLHFLVENFYRAQTTVDLTIHLHYPLTRKSEYRQKSQSQNSLLFL